MAENGTGVLRSSLNDFLSIQLDEAALDRLTWRDFGNGLEMSRLAREGKRELVLYRIAADASPEAFLKHEHLGGEFYLVLKGKIGDETGEYARAKSCFSIPIRCTRHGRWARPSFWFCGQPGCGWSIERQPNFGIFLAKVLRRKGDVPMVVIPSESEGSRFLPSVEMTTCPNSASLRFFD